MDVVRRRESFGRLFDGGNIFRRSLKTKDHGEMHLAAVQVHEEFEALVGHSRGKPVVKTVKVERASPPLAFSREVTDADLSEIKDSIRALSSRRRERTAMFAESGGLDKAYLDRYDLNPSERSIVLQPPLYRRLGAGGQFLFEALVRPSPAMPPRL